MTGPLLLGLWTGVFAVLGVVFGVCFLLAGRAWRWWGVATIVEAVGFGLFGVAEAEDFRDVGVAAAALAVAVLGVVAHGAAVLRAVRARDGGAAAPGAGGALG